MVCGGHSESVTDVASEPRILTTLPYEFQLMLCAAGVWGRKTRHASLRHLVAQNLDWSFLLRLSQSNRIAPLVYQQLREAVGEPFPYSDAFRNAYLSSAATSTILRRELIQLLTLLESANLRAIPLKGPLFASSLYEDAGVRLSSDLDLLVQKKDLLDAVNFLMLNGYRLQPTRYSRRLASVILNERYRGARDGGVRHLKRAMRLDCETHLFGPRCLVELHWQLLPGALGKASETDSFWERAEEASFDGVKTWALTREDTTLAILLHHGVKDHWPNLLAVSDVARIMRAYLAIDWEYILRSSKAKDAGLPVLVGLYLAHMLLGAPMPPGVVRLTERTRVPASAAFAMGRIFSEMGTLPGYHQWHKHWRSLSTAAELGPHFNAIHTRTTYISLGLKPTSGDRCSLGVLPRQLEILYYFWRLGRLVGRHRSGILRRLW